MLSQCCIQPQQAEKIPFFEIWSLSRDFKRTIELTSLKDAFGFSIFDTFNQHAPESISGEVYNGNYLLKYCHSRSERRTIQNFLLFCTRKV